MAFSCRTLWLARRHFLPPTWSKGRTFTSSGSSRHAATTTPTWHAATSLPTSRVQIYTSHSHDPYLNLSAEHFLLQHSHPDSTILFLYTNDPCVVIGRNQNPWLEVNLGLLLSSSADADADADDNKSPEHVRLVRRRSGGGAVFHDRGNVNYSVICPPAVFDRNKHAEMVVRALRGLGVVTAHVNARHDIVILNNENNNDEHENSSPSSFSSSSSSSSFSSQSEGGSSTPSPATFKISGSAYKLTRLRSLHHGTCLLSSPHLAQIGRYLRAPAAPYLKARGVESVRSPIRNVGVATEAFMEGVTREFVDMYGRPDVQVALGRTEGDDDDGGAGSVVGGGGGGDFAHEQIQKGYRELTVRSNFLLLLFFFFGFSPCFGMSLFPFMEMS